MRYRLIKPDWGKPRKGKNKNPDFVKEIKGADVLEGDDFSEEFLHKKNKLGYNIYFFPNAPDKKLPNGYFISGKDVETFKYVFVDMDLKDKVYKSKEEFYDKLDEFPLPPTWTTDSGNGVHAYWEVTDLGKDKVAFMGLQFMLIQHFKTDESVWTPLQLMRVAGYQNTKKHGEFKPAKHVEELTTWNKYTVGELVDCLPEISATNEENLQKHLDKLEGRVSVGVEAFLGDEVPEKFLEDMEKDDRLYELFHHPRKVKGDRSKADLSLANILCLKYDYSREECLAVLMHTEKALSRPGQSRFDYANNTVDRAYMDNTAYAVMPIGRAVEAENSQHSLGLLVNGPYFLDCLHHRWLTKEVLGLVAGTKVGKTSITLKCFKEFIRNNEDSDGIFLYFNLEQTVGEIHQHWKILVGNDPKYFNKLYVISKEMFEQLFEGGAPNIQRIYKIIRDTEKRTGKKVLSVCIDHLQALNGDFNLTEKETFNAEVSEYIEQWVNADTVILNKDGVCQKLKELAKKTNVFLIIQSQTTKGKDDGGSIPIGKNAAFGTAKFEWYCDYVVGLWRPLNLVIDKCKEHGLFITAFQYTAIRHENADKDALGTGEHVYLKFDPETRDYIGATKEEHKTVLELLSENHKMRKIMEKKESTKYRRAPVRRTTKEAFKK